MCYNYIISQYNTWTSEITFFLDSIALVLIIQALDQATIRQTPSLESVGGIGNDYISPIRAGMISEIGGTVGNST